MKEDRKRSVAKALSFRIAATVTTIVVVFVLTGQLVLSLSIGVFDIMSKLVLYYGHERAWDKVSWGNH